MRVNQSVLELHRPVLGRARGAPHYIAHAGAIFIHGRGHVSLTPSAKRDCERARPCRLTRSQAQKRDGRQ